MGAAEDLGGGASGTARRPPVLAWLLYDLKFRRLGVKWRGWVRDDVGSRWFPLRDHVANSCVFVLVCGAIGLLRGEFPIVFAATWVLGGSVYVLLAPLRAHVRRQRLAWHEKKWRRQEGLDPDVPGAF